MKRNKQFRWSMRIKYVLLFMLFLIFTGSPAFADLVSGMNELQDKVRSICQPLAIIFLVIAGWQKAMGNNELFIMALVGTVIMFGAPQIVDFVSTSFGR